MKKIGMVAICIAAVTLSAVAQEARRSRGNRSRGRSRSTGILDPLSSQQLPRNDHEDQLPADQTDLAVRWREAKSSNAKSKIAKALTARLDQMFDDDMARRQQQIDAIEKRLVQLKSLYEKREKAKPKILKLQAQAITMDWEGLGFARSNRAEDSGSLVTELSMLRIVDNEPTGRDQPDLQIEDDVIQDEIELLPEDKPMLDELPEEDNLDVIFDELSNDGQDDDELEDSGPSIDSDVDVLDDVLGQAPFVDENDAMLSRDEEMLEAFRKKYKDQFGENVASFVQSCTPDADVQKELADILLMVIQGYFEYPGDAFRGFVMEAYHRSGRLQRRGEKVATKYFEHLAMVTEEKAKRATPKNRDEYLHLLARLKEAAGDNHKAIKFQRAAVRKEPDNAEYRTFLQRLLKGALDKPADTSIIPFQDDV